MECCDTIKNIKVNVDKYQCNALNTCCLTIVILKEKLLCYSILMLTTYKKQGNEELCCKVILTWVEYDEYNAMTWNAEGMYCTCFRLKAIIPV